jgi:hypothetical protein
MSLFPDCALVVGESRMNNYCHSRAIDYESACAVKVRRWAGKSNFAAASPRSAWAAHV